MGVARISSRVVRSDVFSRPQHSHLHPLPQTMVS
ncbi:unnamed protein product [Haemonchus placei]|uniref:Uncharacterized protein n=1 Tax=Haemonchus placei TaxID=6290 RepID=A0A0N4W7T0_HAEPC|nr:unnamed protein product [Haemonchus placei]